jgi:hypothetical protein
MEHDEEVPSDKKKKEDEEKEEKEEEDEETVFGAQSPSHGARPKLNGVPIYR